MNTVETRGVDIALIHQAPGFNYQLLGVVESQSRRWNEEAANQKGGQAGGQLLQAFFHVINNRQHQLHSVASAGASSVDCRNPNRPLHGELLTCLRLVPGTS